MTTLNMHAPDPRASKSKPRHIVFVVDDDDSVRESLELLIDFNGWEARVFESAQQFLDHARPQVPSCLILDINLPDLNGLDLQRAIATEQPKLPIVFITGYGDIPQTVRAMKEGAIEFLTKPYDDQVLLDTISSALEMSRASLVHEDGLRAVQDAYATLTPREQEIFHKVVTGRLNKLIADDLKISIITVKAHRGKVMRKMNARSVAELVRMAATLASGAAANETSH